MNKKELFRRIKAGAIVYVPLAIKNGKDWEYVEVDKESLLRDLEMDIFRSLRGFHCKVGEDIKAPIWFEPVIEKK